MLWPGSGGGMARCYGQVMARCCGQVMARCYGQVMARCYGQVRAVLWPGVMARCYGVSRSVPDVVPLTQTLRRLCAKMDTLSSGMTHRLQRRFLSTSNPHPPLLSLSLSPPPSPLPLSVCQVHSSRPVTYQCFVSSSSAGFMF